ncbi:uncharacterized protein SETTUDRAFT_40351 [Exserohilum turcica Et28A]|uniref:Uncharacterized protein n=1 Tax=Exserohilum turcicum (strain 28A) TaxID=671987 RepID=R0JX94_EXST2|nr:uncharacterized protein SETTUDRAFT_40351 [Exserohilum turcica Et28A]EOA85553.1 hypothetical protein SETTUDRAFT_40351 [Exserohilum turcica Et28A]
MTSSRRCSRRSAWACLCLCYCHCYARRHPLSLAHLPPSPPSPIPHPPSPIHPSCVVYRQMPGTPVRWACYRIESFLCRNALCTLHLHSALRIAGRRGHAHTDRRA